MALNLRFSKLRNQTLVAIFVECGKLKNSSIFNIEIPNKTITQMTIPEPIWWKQWTRFNEKELRTELRDGAPEEVRAEWENLHREHGIEINIQE